MSTSAPPLLPGLIAALVWIVPGSVTPPGSATFRPRALTMPCVTLDCSPSGLPIAMTIWPTSSFEESAKVAGCRFGAEDLDDGHVVGGERANELAGELTAIGKGDPERRRVADDVGIRGDVPVVVEHDPRSPRPRLVSMTTTDGDTRSTTLS